MDGNYLPVTTTTLADGTVSLASEVLGLELRLKEGEMRFYDLATSQTLLSFEEQASAQQAAEQAQQAAEEKAQRLAAKLKELNIDPDNI
ncbi:MULTISPECIES: hypothetical protein [Nostocales]|uniref:Uma2 family endonuclease n=2 Tax=Nostocales TaxID=1161 RepID=A0ABW8WQ72_9CYAN|nr:hypothetical protein [Tolypothrix bouteillei]